MNPPRQRRVRGDSALRARSRRRVLHAVRLALVSTVVLIGVLLLYRARGALAPFVLGAVLAMLLAPLVDRVTRLLPFHTRRPEQARLLAILAVYLAGSVTLTGLGLLLVPIVAHQVAAFLADAPGLMGEMQRQSQAWLDRYQREVPSDVRQTIEAQLGRLGQSIGPLMQAMLSQALTLTQATVGALLGYLVIPFWLFYVLKDQHQLRPTLKRLLPPTLQADVDACWHIMQQVLVAYLRAQLMLGLVVGTATTLGLAAMGVRFALVLGLLAGITEMVPIVGPILGAIPVLLVTLATAPEKWWWVLLLALAIQQLENAVLVPRLQGNAVRLHPAVVMVLLLVAQQLAGLLGMLVVVPLTAVCKELVVYTYRRLREQERRLAAVEARLQDDAGPRPDRRTVRVGIRRTRPRTHAAVGGLARGRQEGVTTVP